VIEAESSPLRGRWWVYSHYSVKSVPFIFAVDPNGPTARLVKVALLGLSITLQRGNISVAEIHLGRVPRKGTGSTPTPSSVR